MLFYLINEAKGIEVVDFQDFSTLVGLIGFIVTLFSCVRLAKFNLDTDKQKALLGLIHLLVRFLCWGFC